MPWVPKPSAPATFNLPDAFLASITGDATWGWLVDFLPFITNDHFSTADFCSAGPITPPDLGPILGPSPPDRSPLSVLGKIATIGVTLGLVARDRVFGAYCQLTPEPTDPGWSEYVCRGGTTTVDFQNFGIVDLPTGTTFLRWKVTAANTAAHEGARFLSCNVPFAGGNDLGGWAGTLDTVFEIAVPAAPNNKGTYVEWRASGAAVTECYAFYGPGLGAPTPYVPTDQPLPDGVLSPLRTVDPSLDGIAREAELLELKLDTLLSIVQGIAGATLDLGGDVLDPVDMPADTPIAVGDAVGAVITATGIPSSRSLDFGDPQNIVRLGHVNCGTPTAWYPSIWLTHTPFVLRPFPPGTTRVTVTDLPPGCTCTIQLIARNK